MSRIDSILFYLRINIFYECIIIAIGYSHGCTRSVALRCGALNVFATMNWCETQTVMLVKRCIYFLCLAFLAVALYSTVYCISTSFLKLCQVTPFLSFGFSRLLRNYVWFVEPRLSCGLQANKGHCLS